MKLCCDECCPICDYCMHYDFNADKDLAYTGDGWCDLNKTKKDPSDDCDDFHCNAIAEEY